MPNAAWTLQQLAPRLELRSEMRLRGGVDERMEAAAREANARDASSLFRFEEIGLDEAQSGFQRLCQ